MCLESPTAAIACSSEVGHRAVTLATMQHYPAVICDTGTGMIKAGFAGQQTPSVTFPTLVGRPMLRSSEGLVDGLCIRVLGQLEWWIKLHCVLTENEPFHR